ncbi:MAG: GH1 family beta-glucosidase [Bacillota bacterium]|nr:GH1 family beta-glucosidase [Bacillota bacterium]
MGSFHTYSRTIWNQETGDRACDHYHLHKEDVDLMSSLGLKAYRFSISWPRLFPQGRGRINRKRVDFYRRLVEQLHSNGIKTVITLYHWDLPQALQERGEWGNRDTARYFEEYAASVFENMDKYVDMWITINQPWVFASLGHAFGIHAPGINDFNAALLVTHHLLLAYGLAVNTFRESKRKDESIGITLNLAPVQPLTDRSPDREAARHSDGFMNRWFLNPLFKGSYPADMIEIFSCSFDVPAISKEDAALFSRPLDFLGINNYTRILVEVSNDEDAFTGNPVNPPDAKYTEMGWEIYPRGLYELLIRIHHEYGPLPLYITENGVAFADQLNEDGSVGDEDRIKYLHHYLLEAQQAIVDGVPFKGYFVWSLMDNFEWAFSYSKRFGLIYVDFQSQKRYLKKSASWYREVIARNGLIE